MEGPARAIPPVPDLPSLVPVLGSTGTLRNDLNDAGRGLARPRRTRFDRGIHRRCVRPCQKRGPAVGCTKRGKGSKIMVLADRHGLPLGVHVASASPHEVKLVQATLEHRWVKETPPRLIADKGYDSDPLDVRLLEEYDLELIAPHKNNRRKPATQDGRPLRRYRRRWKVERLFAWLNNFRRLVTRYEYHVENFIAMLHLGCILILLRHF